MRIFVAGDVHGNFRYMNTYLYPAAKLLGCELFVQLGDYGFWEHEESGVEFNDAVAGAALRYGIPSYFVRGNHDNLRMLLASYGTRVTEHGFISIRPNLFHIPDGLLWDWGGMSFRAFGGAYSMDKPDRLKRELKRDRHARIANTERRRLRLPEHDYRSAVGSEWFPEEELTDEQMHAFLREYDGRVDVVLSHDKPRSASPGDWWQDREPGLHNQDRLQRALVVHKPSLWLHGHLHLAYRDLVRCGDDMQYTQVYGISCDDVAAPRFGWRPWHSWAVLDTETRQLYPGGSDDVEFDDNDLDQVIQDAYTGDHNQDHNQDQDWGRDAA